MADIDVVKKGSRAWLWFLVVLAALLLVWFLVRANHGATQRIGSSMNEGGQPLHAAALVARSLA